MLGKEQNSIAKAIIDRFEELKGDRNERAEELEMVARLFRPQRQGFRGASGSRRDYNLHSLFNSKTIIAAGNFASTVYSTMCNPANVWFDATTPDPDLASWHENAVWLDLVSRRMRLSFGFGVSNFYSSAVPFMADQSILGSGIFISDESLGGRKRLRDTCYSLADSVFAQDADGWVNELLVEQRLTAVAAARLYGAENLPQKLREKAANNKTDERYRFIQAIQPNDEYVPGNIGKKGMQFLSTHVCEEGQVVVKQGGVYEQNFAVSRYDVDGSNPWGHGMGYVNLASARKLQGMERSNLQAGALAAEPPLGTTGSREMRREAKLAPGKFLHGAISHTGQQLVRPISTFNGLPVTNDMARRVVEEVEHGFHASLLSLVDRTGLGPLEVIERNEERLRMMAPYLGRMQVEGLTPILERRFGLLFRAGQIPPPPPAMKGQPLEIKFTSVAAMALRSQEGLAVARLLDDTGKLAMAQPTPEAAQEVWDMVDTDGAQQVLAEARGVPARVLRSAEDIAARRNDRAEQAAAQQAMAMAEQGAGIGKDLAAMEPPPEPGAI